MITLLQPVAQTQLQIAWQLVVVVHQELRTGRTVAELTNFTHFNFIVEIEYVEDVSSNHYLTDFTKIKCILCTDVYVIDVRGSTKLVAVCERTTTIETRSTISTCKGIDGIGNHTDAVDRSAVMTSEVRTDVGGLGMEHS